MGMCAIYNFKYGPRALHSIEDGEDSPRSGTSSDGSSIQEHRKTTATSNRYEQHPALWKRTIPKGRRCEPLAFSGVILYDEHGNRLHQYNQDLYPREIRSDS